MPLNAPPLVLGLTSICDGRRYGTSDRERDARAFIREDFALIACQTASWVVTPRQSDEPRGERFHRVPTDGGALSYFHADLVLVVRRNYVSSGWCVDKPDVEKPASPIPGGSRRRPEVAAETTISTRFTVAIPSGVAPTEHVPPRRSRHPRLLRLNAL